MSYNIFKILSFSASLTLLCIGCARVDEPMADHNPGLLEISASLPTFDIDETKSGLGIADTLYAYPYAEGTGLASISPDTYIGNTFYYTIPEATSDIIFTSVSPFSKNYSVDIAPTGSIMNITTVSPYGPEADIVYGSLTGYSSDVTKKTIELKRAVAKINATMTLFVGDTQVKESELMAKAISISIDSLYEGLVFSDFSTISYTGLDTVTAILKEASVQSPISKTFYTFPSIEGEIPTLTLTIAEGTSSLNYQVQLPGILEANKSYDLRLKLKQDNLTGTYTIADVTLKDISATAVDDNHEFDLISFSSNTVTFKNLSDGSKDLYIYTRTGSWNAEVSQETLNNFEILYKGVPVTAGKKFSGLDGEFITIEPLNDNSAGTSNIKGFITFDAGTSHKYTATLLQTNGQMQSIDVTLGSYGYVQVYGSDFTVERRDAGSGSNWQTVDTSTEGWILLDSWRNQEYKITAAVISELEIAGNPVLNDLQFTNCSALESFTIYGLRDDSGYKSLDLTGLTNLRNLYITEYYNQGNTLTSIDLSNCKELQTAFISLGKLATMSFADGYPQLKSFILKYADITSIDLSDSPMLQEFIYNDCYDLENINLENCTSLTSFEYPYNKNVTSSNKLKSLNIKGCSSLQNLYLDLAYLTDFTSLDLSGLDNLKNANILNSRTYYSNGPDGLTKINLAGSNIRKLTLDRLSSMNSLTFSADSVSSVDTLNMTQCAALTSLKLNDQQIKVLELSSSDLLQTIQADNTTLNTVKFNSLKKLANVSIQNSTSLDTLSFSNCSQLTRLYLTGSTAIRYFSIWDVTSSTMSAAIGDVSSLTNLTHLRLQSVPCTTLDLSNNTALRHLELKQCSALTAIDCSDLPLEDVNIQSCSAIVTAEFENMANLKDLSFQPTSETLTIDNCPLLESANLSGESKMKTLTIGTLTNLKDLTVSGYALTDFTLGSVPSLESLELSYSNIKTFTIPADNKLTRIKLYNVQYLDINSLDFNSAGTLEDFESYYAGYYNYDIPNTSILNFNGYSKLKRISLERCKVYNMNITGCNSLKLLDLYSSQFGAEALDSIFTALPECDPFSEDASYFRIEGTPGASTCNTGIATGKGWTLTADRL